MHTIHQRHLPGSPELMAIATAKRKRKPFMVDGLPYTLNEWQPKEGRIHITLIPFGAEHARTPD